MKKIRKQSLFHSLTEPFEDFYLGFLASLGLALGLVMIINVLRKIFTLFFEIDILIYSRILLSILYIGFFVYTYWFLYMKKNKALRNGFILFAVLYVLGQAYIWIF